MNEFTKEQLSHVCAFLAQVRERARIEREEAVTATNAWLKGLRAWNWYPISEANIHTAIWWYQYRHAPGSKTWQPSVILRALVAASEHDYVEPERMPPNNVALGATPAE